MPSIGALKDELSDYKYLLLTIGDMLSFEEALEILISLEILTSVRTSRRNVKDLAFGAVSES